MKSILALAAFAASAEAVVGINISANFTPEGAAAFGIDIQVPTGIELPEGVYPSGPPPQGRSNVYHPPHHGVDIDECDDDEDDDWHYVHPGSPIYPEQPPHVWTTSTVTVVHTSTIIDCDDDVPNCPGKATHYTTIEIPASTTICPVVPGPTETHSKPPHETYYVPPPVQTTTKKHHSSTETLPVPMETPVESNPGHPEPSSSPCPTTVVPTPTGPSSIPHSAPPAHTPEHPCPGGPNCPPPYAPPAGHPSSHPHGHKHHTTLYPQGPSGTISIVHPPATPTGHVVTAGAVQNVQRVGVALAAGLFIALA